MGRGGRIGPACAGKRYEPLIKERVGEDHPRMCGEKLVCSWAGWKKVGSPPHVRGKVQAVLVNTFCVRITPACAGKRAAVPVGPFLLRDHPRMCGEKIKPKDLIGIPWGSPPHVRGKGLCVGLVLRAVRITPACAGKRMLPAVFFDCPADHPRMCGEKYGGYKRGRLGGGSPPHVRGKAPCRIAGIPA